LTESDRERLIAAGYPKESVFALSDPVEAESNAKPFSPEERTEMDRRIAAWSRRQGFRFTEGGRWLLAPIRAIRRKNILELAILIRLLGPQWRLLVTLDCNSEPERPYAEYVKDSFRYTQTEATLGFGVSLFDPPFSFERFYASVDAVATSSVLEGFGLVFAESVFAGRPLIGRDLPAVTGELPGIQREGLYSELRVSPGESERQRLRALYREKWHVAPGRRTSARRPATKPSRPSIEFSNNRRWISPFWISPHRPECFNGWMTRSSAARQRNATANY
jgi:hypothetical protein